MIYSWGAVHLRGQKTYSCCKETKEMHFRHNFRQTKIFSFHFGRESKWNRPKCRPCERRRRANKHLSRGKREKKSCKEVAQNRIFLFSSLFFVSNEEQSVSVFLDCSTLSQNATETVFFFIFFFFCDRNKFDFVETFCLSSFAKV